VEVGEKQSEDTQRERMLMVEPPSRDESTSMSLLLKMGRNSGDFCPSKQKDFVAFNISFKANVS
jgi:hypothetical protein